MTTSKPKWWVEKDGEYYTICVEIPLDSARYTERRCLTEDEYLNNNQLFILDIIEEMTVSVRDVVGGYGNC